MVGEVVGLSAWWVVLPSHALVLFVHGGFWPLWGRVVGSGSAGGGGRVRGGSGGGGGGVGGVGSAGGGGGGGGWWWWWWCCGYAPRIPWRSDGAWGSGIVCNPWGCKAWWIAGLVLGLGLTATAVEVSHVPGSVWPAVVVVCGQWMLGRLETGMWTMDWTGSCCVADSVVAAPAGGT